MCANIKIQLVNADIWAKFGKENEMVINKMGRNLFPVLGWTIEGLEPLMQYSIEVEILPKNQFKYKFVDSEWRKMSEEPATRSSRSIQHPDGIKSGEQWMGNEVSFPQLKITSDERTTDPNQIFVEARRKYIPILNIQKLSHDGRSLDLIGRYSFVDVEFVAVTAYKNQRIADLKKIHNKHAGGDRKRKRQTFPQEVKKENNSLKKMCTIQEEPVEAQNSFSTHPQDFNSYVSCPLPNYQLYDTSRENSSNSSASSQPLNFSYDCNYSPELFSAPLEAQPQYFHPPAQFVNSEVVPNRIPFAPINLQSSSSIYPLSTPLPPEPKCYNTGQSFASQVSSNYYY